MTTNTHRRLLVVQVAALGHELVRTLGGGRLAGLPVSALDPVFPAVTCPVQASFRTARPPAQHGMVANGFFDRDLARVLFWEQSSALVQGPRIWERYRAAGGTVAMLFWQQSLGEPVDSVVSPAPIHRHHGGMIDDCYSRPSDLYRWLCAEVGRPFALRRYWGPLASARSSAWIAEATAALLASDVRRPGLCLTYLPGLDYDLQRFGPGDVRSRRAVHDVLAQLERLVGAARAADYEVVVYGDYAIGDSSGGAVLPNLALAEAGLLRWREVRGMRYADLASTPAVAVVDHEVAHVYVRQSERAAEVRQVLGALDGVGEVVSREGMRAMGLDHARAGELLLVAAPGRWFAYPWWGASQQAPDYAGHVDIHNKPGYDPCELFFGWPPGSVSRDTRRVRGSHGRAGAERAAAWASTCLPAEPTTLLDLASRTQTWLNARL